MKKSSFYHTPCIRRPRRSVGTLFGMERLEWCRYPMVKKFRRYVYSFWRDPRTWQTDGRTDRHRITAKTAYASHGAVIIGCNKSACWATVLRSHRQHGDKANVVAGWNDFVKNKHSDVAKLPSLIGFQPSGGRPPNGLLFTFMSRTRAAFKLELRYWTHNTSDSETIAD